MTWLWTHGNEARGVVLGVILGGLVAAALGPVLLTSLGPVLPAAVLAVGLALGGWIGRGARGSLPGRLVLALLGGGLAGWLAAGQVAPAGLAHAVFGLGVGLALMPEGLRGGLARSLIRALPSGAGALAGGVCAGGLLHAPAVVSLSPQAGTLVLAGCVSVGVALAELVRYVIVFHETPPRWIQLLTREAGDATRPVLQAACDAYQRVVVGIREAQAGLDVWDQRESLDLAYQLLEGAAREGKEADRVARERVGLEGDDTALAGHTDLIEARAKLRSSLDARLEAALERAGKQAAALARLATTLQTRAAGGSSDASPDSERLLVRAEGLHRPLAGEKHA
jgi:hypothetical protein